LSRPDYYPPALFDLLQKQAAEQKGLHPSHGRTGSDDRSDMRMMLITDSMPTNGDQACGGVAVTSDEETTVELISHAPAAASLRSQLDDLV